MAVSVENAEYFGKDARWIVTDASGVMAEIQGQAAFNEHRDLRGIQQEHVGRSS